ncbi:MAG: hypothetical protein K0S07_825 [Chlamydiales bacterium]|jgi:asparagine synthase (glutamine-hydrolysing)|nr:hypothetical protein [Chlamydiales bacterium]
MGAIAGIIYPDRFQVTHRIEELLESLKYRDSGKSASHSYLNSEVGARGDTAFAMHSKLRLTVGFDGFIVNFEKAVLSLHKKGLRVQAKNGAELILQAYKAFGSLSFLDDIDGDFALFILDQEKGELLLARDRLGKKPLYWYQDSLHFIFASELKAILATGYVPQSPAEDGLSHYLFFGYLPQDMTLVKGVSKLLPGYMLKIDLSQAKSIKPYWSLSALFESKQEDKIEVVEETLKSLLKESIQLRLTANQPVGCSFFGGLGSAAAALYAKELTSDVTAYNALFPSEESIQKESEETAAALGCAHATCWLSSGFADLPKILWHLDEPLADLSMLANWQIVKAAHLKSALILSGIGSGELLLTKERYFFESNPVSSLSLWLESKLKPLKRSVAVPLLNLIWPSLAFRILRSYPSNPWQTAYLQQNALFPEEEHSALSPTLSGVFDTALFLNRFHKIHHIESTTASFLYLDLKTRVVDSQMHQYDRLSAAHGLNWHAPFLDHKLFSYLIRVFSTLAKNRETHPSPLAALLEGKLSQTMIENSSERKSAFARHCLRELSLKPFKGLYKKSVLVDMGLVSSSWLKEAFVEEREMTFPHFQQLFSILSLEAWFRLFMDQSVATSPPDCSLEELLLD